LVNKEETSFAEQTLMYFRHRQLMSHSSSGSAVAAASARKKVEQKWSTISFVRQIASKSECMAGFILSFQKIRFK